MSEAERYAKAVMQAMVERWQEALAQADALAKGPIADLLGNSGAAVEVKLEGFKNGLPSDTPAEVLNLLGMLIQADDIDKIPDVAASLAEIATGQSAPLKAEITSAIELSDSDKENMRQKLIRDHGDGLIFNFQVDESLMGGLRVRVGDQLTDTSVASQLSALRETLATAVR